MVTDRAKVRYKIVVQNREKVAKIEDLQSAISTTKNACKRLHGELYERKNCFKYWTIEKKLKAKVELEKAKARVREKETVLQNNRKRERHLSRKSDSLKR